MEEENGGVDVELQNVSCPGNQASKISFSLPDIKYEVFQ